MRSLAGETALGIDLFDWPNPEVADRFEANCAKHGVPPGRYMAWKADSRAMAPAELLAKLEGRRPRFVHIDGEHSRAALTKDLELATAVLAPEGVIVLDDMLHPGYPTLMVAVHEYLQRHPEMCVLCIIDRETVVAATKFVLCRATGSSATRSACSRPTRIMSGRWAPTSSRTGAWCCRSTPGLRISPEAAAEPALSHPPVLTPDPNGGSAGIVAVEMLALTMPTFAALSISSQARGKETPSRHR